MAPWPCARWAGCRAPVCVAPLKCAASLCLNVVCTIALNSHLAGFFSPMRNPVKASKMIFEKLNPADGLLL